MFFPPNFAPDVWLTFSALDIPLQEAVLDVIDEVEAEMARRRSVPGDFAKREEELTVPSGTYLAFIEVVLDRTTSRIRVIGLGVVRR